MNIIYENNLQKENNLTNINSPENDFVETINTVLEKKFTEMTEKNNPLKIQSIFDNITL